MIEVVETEKLLTQEQIENIVEEIQGILVEGEFTSRWVLLETYHKIGQIIIANFTNTKEACKTLAVRIEKSERTLYYAVAFVKKYPNLDNLPEGKAISWNKIVHKYLPNPGEKENIHEHGWFGTLECACGEKKTVDYRKEVVGTNPS